MVNETIAPITRNEVRDTDAGQYIPDPEFLETNKPVLVVPLAASSSALALVGIDLGYQVFSHKFGDVERNAKTPSPRRQPVLSPEKLQEMYPECAVGYVRHVLIYGSNGDELLLRHNPDWQYGLVSNNTVKGLTEVDYPHQIVQISMVMHILDQSRSNTHEVEEREVDMLIDEDCLSPDLHYVTHVVNHKTGFISPQRVADYIRRLRGFQQHDFPGGRLFEMYEETEHILFLSHIERIASSETDRSYYGARSMKAICEMFGMSNESVAEYADGLRR